MGRNIGHICKFQLHLKNVIQSAHLTLQMHQTINYRHVFKFYLNNKKNIKDFAFFINVWKMHNNIAKMKIVFLKNCFNFSPSTMIIKLQDIVAVKNKINFVYTLLTGFNLQIIFQKKIKFI